MKELSMKRTILPAALALVLAGSVAFAQQTTPAPAPDAQQPAAAPAHRHHKPNPERETARMTKQLNLTSDQAAKVEPILADRDQKMEALWSNTALAPQDKHQQMRAIHQSTQQQLDAVLTPDQVQQLKAMHHGHHGNGQEQPATPPPAA
jgi:periplasmic protein CpxP/Spy